MANQNWKKGGPSPNPDGRLRMKNSSRTVRGMVERFIKKNITPNKLQAMYDGLKPAQQIEMLLELMPYCVAKQSSLSIESKFADLSDADLKKLHDSVLGSISIAEVIEPEKEPAQPLLLNPVNYSRYGQD